MEKGCGSLKVEEERGEDWQECPFADDCPMIGFVAPGAVRRAMQRLLCHDSYEECVWLRIKVDSPLPRDVIVARLYSEVY